MYGYFLWNHKDAINSCPADEVERQHSLKPEDAVYFLTKNGSPFMIMPPNSTEKEAVAQVQALTEAQQQTATFQQVVDKVNLLENVVDEMLVGENSKKQGGAQ